MDYQAFDGMAGFCRDDEPLFSWVEAVQGLATEKLRSCGHGDFPRWQAALDSLPPANPEFDLAVGTPRFGAAAEPTGEIRSALMTLHPWRKGPLRIAGIEIDTEWRSDWKWDRIRDRVDLGGQTVLDIGCGNGYFGWRMLAAGARLVVGIDPTWVYVMQWLACRHFSGELSNYVLPLGVEDLPDQPAGFDNVFSMGVLYHRRNPARHLARLRSLTKPGGRVVLETLVLPEDRADEILVPESRYARMRNVWAVPGLEVLVDWVRQAGFSEIQVAHVGRTTIDEQRTTGWMTFESLDKALDPKNPSLTVEGHPAPRRAVVIAERT